MHPSLFQLFFRIYISLSRLWIWFLFQHLVAFWSSSSSFLPIFKFGLRSFFLLFCLLLLFHISIICKLVMLLISLQQHNYVVIANIVLRRDNVNALMLTWRKFIKKETTPIIDLINLALIFFVVGSVFFLFSNQFSFLKFFLGASDSSIEQFQHVINLWIHMKTSKQ